MLLKPKLPNRDYASGSVQYPETEDIIHLEELTDLKINTQVILYQWFAIYSRSNFEKKLYRGLRQSGLEAFLPLVKEKRAWSDRLKTIEVPLLPCYVFTKLARNQLHLAYPLPGFVRYVTFDGKPSVVRGEEIKLLQQIIAHGMRTYPAAQCTMGDRVRVVRGALKGWEGKVERTRGTSRIVFQLESIRQALSVEVGAVDVEKIKDIDGAHGK